MAGFEKQIGHVPLHRLWAFATLRGELAFPEHLHLSGCEECRAAFQKCVEVDSFGELLKHLNREDQVEGGDSKAG